MKRFRLVENSNKKDYRFGKEWLDKNYAAEIEENSYKAWSLVREAWELSGNLAAPDKYVEVQELMEIHDILDKCLDLLDDAAKIAKEIRVR